MYGDYHINLRPDFWYERPANAQVIQGYIICLLLIRPRFLSADLLRTNNIRSFILPEVSNLVYTYILHRLYNELGSCSLCITMIKMR